MEAQTTTTPIEDKQFTFKVDKVKVFTNGPNRVSPSQAFAEHFGKDIKIEDSSFKKQIVPNIIRGFLPGFLEAVHTAYAVHYPLKLSVSDFIIMIGQGLGKHIDNNAEKLRHHFVNHEGKQEIVIDRSEFVLGKQNDWSTVFGEFAEELKKRVKSEIHDVVVDDTSVSTKTTRIVSEITLMECLKNYFSYKVRSACGIPEVTLVGSPEDWEKLRQKVHKLVEMNRDDCLDLDWWLKHLVPVIEKICDTGSKREADLKFWSGIYKYKESYLSYEMSGWITVFFPYLQSKTRNRFDGQLSTSEVPKQISEVPFIWSIQGKEIPMTFCGGFLGAKFNEKTFTVEPAYFWSVLNLDPSCKSEQKTAPKKK